MKVLNIHERELEANHERVGGLIDSLSSEDDRLWPKHYWPRMKFDRPLSIGADGGHGPIRYSVEEYNPGQSIKFRFTSPKGFNGFHRYEVVRLTQQSVLLRHTIEMTLHGAAFLTWPLWVKLIRWVMSGGKTQSQIRPDKADSADAKSRAARGLHR